MSEEDLSMLTHKKQRIVRALVREVDNTLRQTYRQSLKEVVQDLTLRNTFRSSHPNDAQILRTLYETGVLRMGDSAKTAELHAVLGRFARGTIDICAQCGGSIESRRLEGNVSVRLCTRCQRKHLGRR